MSLAAPGGKGGWFCHTPMVAIARNIGRKRAAELALSGDVIDAATAQDWGLGSNNTAATTTPSTLNLRLRNLLPSKLLGGSGRVGTGRTILAGHGHRQRDQS